MSIFRIYPRSLSSFVSGHVSPRRTGLITSYHIAARTFSTSISPSSSSSANEPVAVVPLPIDFDTASTILGAESHVLTVQLEPGQVLRAETGAMLFMTSGIDMNTSLGGNQGISSGFKRMITGQNLFISDFTYSGPEGTKGTVGLGTDFPSKILRFPLKVCRATTHPFSFPLLVKVLLLVLTLLRDIVYVTILSYNRITDKSLFVKRALF